MKKIIFCAVLFVSSILGLYSQSLLSTSNSLNSNSTSKSKTNTESEEDVKIEKEEEFNLEDSISAQLAMSNPDYPVTAGDIYRLMFVAQSTTVDYFIPVDTTYKIRIANLAVLDARGKTFVQLKKEVTEIVSSNYPLSGVQFILTNPSIFNVLVKGEVSSAKEVKAWPLSRVSDLIKSLKTEFSSERNVIVTDKNGTKKTYDIFKAIRYGDISQNPYVKPGDTITVQRINKRVTIKGAVERPGTYELLENENLIALINSYASGLQPFADTTDIEVKRISSDAKKLGEIINISSKELQNDFELKNHDTVSLRSLEDSQPVVYLTGAVRVLVPDQTTIELNASNKIVQRFTPGQNYAFLIRNVTSYFGSTSDLKNSYIVRDGQILPLNIEEILYDEFKLSPYVVEAFDTLVVPFKQFYVTVSGAVRTPGRYPYIPDRDWSYYVGLAGGFTDSNAFDAVTIRDINGEKISKSGVIQPECTIEAKNNSFFYGLNKVSPLITTIISILSISLTVYTVAK